jgi:predicted enzyme related to lactoylglutathione lyase
MSNFAHMELNTSDPEEAIQFYQSLFGWKFARMPMPGGMDYFVVDDAENPGIGLMRKPMPDAPDCWLGYVSVASAPAAVAKARELGAQVLVEGIVVPGIGEWAVLMDPTGAPFGVWAPENPPPPAKKGKKAKPPKKAKKVAKRANKAARRPKKVPRRANKAARKPKKAPKRANKAARRPKKAPRRANKAARKGKKR